MNNWDYDEINFPEGQQRRKTLPRRPAIKLYPELGEQIITEFRQFDVE
jgi:hypothetical protein